MKKVIQTSLFLMIAVLITSVSFGQVHAQKQKPPKVKAQQVINITAKTIHDAQRAVKEGKNFTGDLAAAVKHQKFAQKLFKEGKYKKAGEHSFYARKRAIVAIKANNKEVSPAFEKQPKAEVAATMASDTELEAEVEGEEENEESLIEGEVLQLNVD